MFGLDKAKTPAGLAAMAGGALAMKGIGNVVGKLSGKKVVQVINLLPLELVMMHQNC